MTGTFTMAEVAKQNQREVSITRPTVVYLSSYEALQGSDVVLRAFLCRARMSLR